VQQAVYTLIPDAAKQAVHYRVRHLLWRNTPPAAREEHLFAIVHQLNLGRGLLAEQTARDEVAALNLAAAVEPVPRQLTDPPSASYTQR
jgi:predicted ATPase